MKSIKFKNNMFFDGEICDIGSNANNTYVKWANGLMICFRITEENSASYQFKWGEHYVFKIPYAYDFPEKFIEPPFLMYDILPTSNYGCYKIGYASPTVTANSISDLYVARTDASSYTYKIWFLAIGYWK